MIFLNLNTIFCIVGTTYLFQRRRFFQQEYSYKHPESENKRFSFFSLNVGEKLIKLNFPYKDYILHIP